MIDDPELLQLTNAATELMTLQSLATFLQNHRGYQDELQPVMDTFNALQRMLVEAMSRRIVELALIQSHSITPPHPHNE